MSELETRPPTMHGAQSIRTVRVAIGIVTYRRTAELQRLLRSLRSLEPLGVGAELAAVIVVDNDPEASAAVVRTDASATRLPLHYAVEATPGISAARNRAVMLASSMSCHLLAFVDDDEETTPGWLRHLVHLQMTTGAHLVAGPTLARLPDGTRTWMTEDLFNRSRMPTGSTFRFASSANLLVDLAGTSNLSPLFDLRYGLTGGSDTHLFMRARAAGLVMKWCDEAVVNEFIPENRTSLAWILKRAFRSGNTVGLCERDIALGRHQALVVSARCTKAAVHIAHGAGEVLVGVVRRHPALTLTGAKRVINSLGMLAGVAGYRYEEYRRPANDLSVRPTRRAS